MQLLLTILSGLALWALLGALVLLLGRIQASLQGINTSLSKIAMGVRAIESETAILPAELPATAMGLTHLADGAEVIVSRLASAEHRLAELAR